MTDEPLDHLEHPGVGLAAFLLSFHTIIELMRNKVLTQQQAVEIVEQALLNLETQMNEANPASRDVISYAHSLLEQLRHELHA